MANIVNLLCNL